MLAMVERSTWDKVKEQYFAGDWKTLRELAEKNSVDYKLLRNRVYEGWKEELQASKDKLRQKVDEKKVSLAENYLSRTFKRAERYEKLIDLSQDQLSAMAGKDGLPVLDPDALLSYAKVEATVHALAKSALRISDKLDVTSNNQSIGESFVSAIAKMRENKDLPKLTDEDYKNVMEMEIID